MSNFVYLPGLPSPMSLPSNLTTGTIPLVVTAIKSSSESFACCGVKDFSIISNPIFLPASIANLRVM
jgi:archaellum component FlaG (FlaF/FlaG flagellin family)